MPIRENKHVIIGDEARAGILRGVKLAYDAVKVTFGPMSANVAITKTWGDPRITHDGVTVAREIKLHDELENIGAGLVNQASTKTNDVAGDGTSATVILAYHIHALAHKSITSGRNAMRIKRGINAAAIAVKLHVDENTVPAVEGKRNSLKAIATISASGDKALGELIADTVQQVGNGVTIEEYPGLNVDREIIEGFYYEKGFASPQLQNVIETEDDANPLSVLVLERHITKTQELFPFLKHMTEKAKRNKILIVGGVSGHALNFLVSNVMNGNLEVTVSDSPIYGQQRTEFLLDVAALTGATVIPAGQTNISMAHLGKAQRVVVTGRSTTIVQGQGDTEQVQIRISAIHKALETEQNEVIRQRMTERLAKLEGRIGLIRVGGATDVDRKETKDRVDDAVHATQAAQESGIVPGGASMLVAAGTHLREQIQEQTTGLANDDEVEGYRIVSEALKQPFIQLMLNSGQPAELNLALTIKKGFGFGYNAEDPSDNPISLFNAGVVDPAKVIKTEVENACSVAAELVTTDAAIVHVDIEKVEDIDRD